MKFGKYLIATGIPEWKNAYFDYKTIKGNISNEIPKEGFIIKLNDELQKIICFYFNEIDKLRGKYRFIQYTLDTNDNKKNNKKILRDFYQLNEFLQNYQKLNKIAFVKIIKKYDKKNDSNLSIEILQNYIDNPVFSDDSCNVYIDNIINLTCSISKNKKEALITLRGNDKPIKDEFTFFKVGLYIGLCIPMIVLSIIKIINEKLTSGIWYSILYIYGGIFIIILSLFGFGIDIYIWRKYRINYIFIFELNWGSTLTWKQFFTFGSISLLLWSASLLLTVYQITIYFKFIPLIFIGISIFLMFCPLRCFYFSSRKWFLKTLFHIFTPFFRKIAFSDFFIADLMVSLTFFWSSLYMLICFYSNANEGICVPNQSYITPIIICIPLVIRCIQCIKKYWEYKRNDAKKTTKKQLFNAAKYFFTISAVFGSSFNSISQYQYVTIIWIILALISTGYSYYWDLIYDWNIYGNNKLISRNWLITAIIINLFLRFNWILTINTFLLFDKVFLSFLFSCLEIIRRYMWSIFRLELEHISNIEQYRAIDEIPILNEDRDSEV